MTRLRPFFPFYGSKWNIARHYLPPLRDHSVIEPFAGAAGYSTFHQVAQVRLYDKDPIIVGVWSYLMRATAAEILKLPNLLSPGDSVDDHQIPQEAKWLIGFWLNRGSASPKKTRTLYSNRTDRSQLNWGPKAKLRIASQLKALSGWSIREGDFSQAVGHKSSTWFIDPPYETKGKYYRVKMTHSDYSRLAAWAQSLHGRVIVCEGEGATWLPFDDLGSYKSSRGRAVERVWTRG